MKAIENMNGYEFSDFLKDAANSKDKHIRDLAKETKKKYFDDRNISIIESWEDDPDDVWDAEAFFVQHI